MLPIDLTGHQYGRWRVLERQAGRRAAGGQRIRTWLCRCACGTEKVIDTHSLRGGLSRSCGCLRDEVASARLRGKPGTTALALGRAMSNVVFEQYRRDAHRKGREFALSKDEFMRLVAEHCVYCGVAPSTVAARPTANGTFTYNGIDRHDSRGGYTTGNVVPCCRPCNDMKGTLDATEFIQRCRNVAYHWSGMGIHDA